MWTRCGRAPVAQTKTVAAEVDLDDRELLGGESGEHLLAQLLLQALEGRARQDLAVEALGRRPPSAGTDRQVDARNVGDRAQAFFDDRLAEEPGAAGDQDGLPAQRFGDHPSESRGSGENPRREIRRSRWPQIRV